MNSKKKGSDHFRQVGEACVNYSHVWRRPKGLYVSIQDNSRICDVLASWPNAQDGRIAVVTDGESGSVG